MKHISIYLAFFLMLMSCNTQPANKSQENVTNNVQVTQQEEVQQNQISYTEPFLVINRTPCFGTCPTYEMKIFKDRIEYNGLAFVPHKGLTTVRINDNEFQEIEEDFAALNFENITDQHNENIADIPYLKFTYNDESKYFLTNKRDRKQAYFDFVEKIEKNIGVYEPKEILQ